MQGALIRRVPTTYEMVAPTRATDETGERGADVAVSAEVGRTAQELGSLDYRPGGS